MMKTVFATIFDVNYVVRSLHLYNSCAPFLGDSKFAFYCVDDEGADLVERLSPANALIFRPADYEDEQMRAIRRDRNRAAYCWTLKPVVLTHALARDPDWEWLVYLDTDAAVFGDINEALAAAGNASGVITPHRFFRGDIADESVVGSCNAGFAAFRNDGVGRDALAWWLARCIESCPFIPTDGAYADQRYLDTMAELFPGVVKSPLKGLNTAPWNVGNYEVSTRNGTVFVDDEPLYYYHFQAFTLFGARLFELYGGKFPIPDDARRHIYGPYIAGLQRSLAMLRQVEPGFSAGLQPLFSRPRVLANRLKRALAGNNNLIFA